jgi:hypothetical protein
MERKADEEEVPTGRRVVLSKRGLPTYVNDT